MNRTMSPTQTNIMIICSSFTPVLFSGPAGTPTVVVVESSVGVVSVSVGSVIGGRTSAI